MHKISLIGLLIALVPSICMGESMRVNRLIQEKQRKMAELEKCMGATNGLKIAGISTLGLTAAGVVGNIAEAKKIKEYDDKIESEEKKIEKTQKQIDETRADLAEQKAKAEAERKAAEAKLSKQRNCATTNGTWNDALTVCTCNQRAGYVPDISGLCVYNPTQANANSANSVNSVNGGNGTNGGTNGSNGGTGNSNGSNSGTGTNGDGGTSGNDSGDGSGNGDGENSTAAAQQCGIRCEGDYAGKTIACGGSKIELYKCEKGLWTKITKIDDCKDCQAPSGYKKLGKWKSGDMVAQSANEISGTSSKVWEVSNYCEAYGAGILRIDGNCQKGCEFDGKKVKIGDTDTGVCKYSDNTGDIENSESCTWQCGKDGTWTRMKLERCKDDYTVSANGQTCVKNKVTKKLKDVIKDARSTVAARGPNKQCYINRKESNTPGSCSSLNAGEWIQYYGNNRLWGQGDWNEEKGKCDCTVTYYTINGSKKTVQGAKTAQLSKPQCTEKGCNYLKCPEHCSFWCNYGEENDCIKDAEIEINQ